MTQIASPGATARSTRLAVLTGLAVSASTSLGAPANIELSVAGGLRFEDNLVVDSLDVSSPESDVAAVGTLDLSYEDAIGITATEDTEMRAGYVFEQRKYFNESDFDLQLHYGYVDLSQELAGITAGAVLDATYARIGGDSLLNRQSLSGYVSDLLTSDLYVRGSLGLETTEFSGDRRRDNNGQSLDASGFYFLDGIRQYLTLKARYHQEQAGDPVFDYNAQRISLGYTERLTLPGQQPLRVRADWRYERRRYDETDPVLNARRRDDRTRWRLRLDTPLSQSVSLELSLEHRNYNSNNAALDFRDNRIEILVDVALL